MPLLRGKLFVKDHGSERLRDSDEVFYCETTNEIFSNYEDYFHRVMLISSTVWSCTITGKHSLTYEEARESEKQARKQLKSFPSAVRGPFLVVASHTKRSSLNEMLEDVFGFIKDHYFKAEEVDALDPNGKTYRNATVMEVIAPNNRNSPIKADKLKYRVSSNDGRKPKEWTIISENLRRERGAASRDKCKLFLKQHVELVAGVLKIKESSYKKFVVDEGLNDEQIFFGKPPDFEQSKRLKNAEEKKLRLEQDQKKSQSQKTTKKKAANDGKQPSISKYLNKSTEETSKSAAENSEKESEKKLKEEMERVRKEKAEKEALEKKRIEEQKAILSEQVAIAIKKFNRVQEDQELSDQRVIPKPNPVSTIMGTKHFGEFLFILEFVTSFAELLSIKDKFANGLTIDLLERALLLKEVNGPLSDIFQVLLSTIFSLQLEEENEVAVRYDNAADFGNRRNGILVFKKATDAAVWCETHYCAKLNELPMDSTTVSEMLRLHFLMSGALIEEKGAKWRYSIRGGYQSFDDPGVALVVDYPHIFRALKSYTVFQLPVCDILKILKCLIDQLLTYSSVRDLVEERVEKSRIARLQYLTANVAKKKRESRVSSEKWDMKMDIRKKVTALEGTNDAKAALRKELEEKMAQEIIKMDAEAERDIKILQKDIDKCKESFFDYQIYLGSDRAHRSYWLFESFPGLFVEHNRALCGKCLDKPTPNIPGLASCLPDQRKKFITQTIMNYKLSENDKENHDIKGELVIEKLLLSGNARIKGLNDHNKVASLNGETKEGAETIAKDPTPPTTEELLMCTANPKACPIHTDHYPDTIRWGFYYTEEEIDALIESLNPRGTREKVLRETLENEKELILNHIKNCPVEKITAKTIDRETVLAGIISKYSRKYEAPNFNHEPGADASDIFESILRENILELESKITVGYLGDMKVSDRDEWREAIEKFDYKQLSEPLRWGPKRVVPFKEKKEDQDEQDEGMENDESDDDMEKLLSHGNDPGYDLPDTMVFESEDSSDEAILLHDSVTLREKVHSLAKALLQVEQCIDSKFLRHPFGPKKETKDKATLTKKLIEGQRNLARWEESLMRATNFSQIFLHYNVLYDAIQWSRSAERIACMICRRKGDPDMTLLCDECNRACHMYCLKPKLKQVPEGDWFCPKCRPEDYAKKKQTKKRKVFVEEEPVEEMEDEILDETIADEDNNDLTQEEEIDCKKCKTAGATAICFTCSSAYHPECTKSLTNAPKKRWNCDKCKKAAGKKSGYSNKSKKSKKKVAIRLAAALLDDGNDNDEHGDNYDKEEDTLEGEEMEDSSVVNGHNGDVESMNTTEVEEELQSSSISKRRTSKRKASEDSDNSSDNETLLSKVKRNRRSSSKRSITNGHHDDDNPHPSPKSRRSTTMNNTTSDDLESSSSRRARRTGDDLPLNSVALYTLIDDILKHNDSWPFNRPVSMKEVPDYYTIIKNPMDFAKIKSKLNMGEYTINEQMMNDVQLVFRNCDLYNTNETDIYHVGRNLERYVEKRSKELSLPFKSSDMLRNDPDRMNESTAMNGDQTSPDGDAESSSGNGKRKSTKK
ncbi:bromodomain adjacent to zinc finger domain protein 1A [Toxorhynchites rutilus septentrionalis]|uniref:bromodomain adjacent to zinc finger domain protein 1A n=1 Tax=Toxorhynchites rutilus septentrionalis TaxID=329112 RepID=UPI00247ADA11|nr:bromodomain adjacent to zinc finger domain protein 1A [Toxorhynchites rutilus septentrionalis]